MEPAAVRRVLQPCRRSFLTTSRWLSSLSFVGGVGERGDAIGLEPEQQFSRFARRHRHEVVRAVVVRGAVDAALADVGAGLLGEGEVVLARRSSSPGTSCARRGARSRCARGFSFFDPTWNHSLTWTIGSLRSTCRITCRPFGSVYFSNSIFGRGRGAAGRGAAGGGPDGFCSACCPNSEIENVRHATRRASFFTVVPPSSLSKWSPALYQTSKRTLTDSPM